MRRAIAVQVMSSDFDDVETELGDLFYVFQAVGAPLLLPIRIINAELHLRLQYDGCSHHTAGWLARPPPTIVARLPQGRPSPHIDRRRWRRLRSELGIYLGDRASCSHS